jgi:hypothetical protein
MKQYLTNSMKIFSILIFLGSNTLFSQSTIPSGYGGPYDEVVCNPEPININAGDVISADVLNEILTRINNLQTGGINSEQDLVGEWSCTSTCRYGACNDTEIYNGYWKNQDGIYIVSQNMKIESVDDTKVLMTYPHNLGQSFSETGPQQCLVRVKNGKIFVTNNVDDKSDYGDTSCHGGIGGGYVGNCNNCFNTGTYAIEMIANQCFRMENINDSVTSCKKINIPPSSPLNLKASFSESSASLSWQKGDDRHTGYTLKRKQTADGIYEAIASVSTDSYTDNSISSGNTYWYRVFGTNEYGEGTGSNVVTITYSE